MIPLTLTVIFFIAANKFAEPPSGEEFGIDFVGFSYKVIALVASLVIWCIYLAT